MSFNKVQKEREELIAKAERYSKELEDIKNGLGKKSADVGKTVLLLAAISGTIALLMNYTSSSDSKESKHFINSSRLIGAIKAILTPIAISTVKDLFLSDSNKKGDGNAS